MPRAETIEALAEAVQTFDATPLRLQVDPEADAVVRESLQRTGLVLLGERHGVEQTPVLISELISWFDLGGIALEWDANLAPWLDRWLSDGVLVDSALGSPVTQVWSGDGRITAGHLAALRRWVSAGILINLIERTPVVRPRPGESEDETARRWWSERDASMADRVLAMSNASGGCLVVAGDLHTRMQPLPVSDPLAAQIGVPMGVELAHQRPGLQSIECVYGPGQFYNVGPRRSRGYPEMQHGDGPRLIVQQGRLVLEVPSPREATVPHRKLP